MSDPPYQILTDCNRSLACARAVLPGGMLTAHRSNRTFATRSNGPRVPNIHLLTQDELVQLKLMWPSPGGVAFEISADGGIEEERREGIIDC